MFAEISLRNICINEAKTFSLAPLVKENVFDKPHIHAYLIWDIVSKQYLGAISKLYMLIC